MSAADKKGKPDVVRAAKAAPTLQSDAATASEAAWFFALFKPAGICLATIATYLGSVKGVVFLLEKLFLPKGESAGLGIKVLGAVIVLPLLFRSEERRVGKEGR